MSQEFAIFSTKGNEPKTQLYAIFTEHGEGKTKAEVVAKGKHNDLLMAYTLITQALIRENHFSPTELLISQAMGVQGFEDMDGITMEEADEE